MLGPWRPHAQFQDWLQERLLDLLPRQEAQIKFHVDALEKVYILNLDPLKKLIWPRYSSIGRPAVNQPEIFRALVLASHYKESISSFVARLKADDVLAVACGFSPGDIPGVGSFYDFFNRLWLAHAPAKVLRTPYKKKKKKLMANEKLHPDNPDTVADLVNQVLGEKLSRTGLKDCCKKYYQSVP